MKLFKKGGVYHARFATAAGKAKTITTRCTSRDEAALVAKESGLDKLELAAKSGRLTREAIGQIVTGKRLTLEKCLEPFREDMLARGRSPKTVANNLSMVGQWMREMKLEKPPPATVTARHISDWINNPESLIKRSSRTVNLAALRTFFDFLRGEGWIVADVSRKVVVDHSVLTHEQKETEIKVPFADAEVALLTRTLYSEIATLEKDIERTVKDQSYSESGREKKLESLNEALQKALFWRFAVIMARETGLRLSDVCQLEWNCFSKAGEVSVWMDKTDQRITHQIGEELQELVTQIPVTHSKHLFPEQRQTVLDIKRRGLLSVQFVRLCERLGITGKSFHCLRHAKATESFHGVDKAALAAKLAEALTADQIRQLLGHSSVKTTGKYIH